MGLPILGGGQLVVGFSCDLLGGQVVHSLLEAAVYGIVYHFHGAGVGIRQLLPGGFIDAEHFHPLTLLADVQGQDLIAADGGAVTNHGVAVDVDGAHPGGLHPRGFTSPSEYLEKVT